ncbi:Checkpoint protein hus1 [Xanthoria calcicola]
MRFKAAIRNIHTFTKLTGSLLLLSKVVWIRLDNDQVRFTVIPERGSQVWAVLSIDSIFEDYSVQSNTPGNTIHLQVSLTHLNRALRSGINATSASIRLTKKDGIPLLAITITTTTFASLRRPPTLEDSNDRRLPSEAPNLTSRAEVEGGNDDSISFQDQPPAPFPSDRETTITQSVAVTVLPPQSVASIHEPTCREPDVHILLPPLLQLKAISERFTKLALPTSSAATGDENLSTRLILSASPYGEFRIGVQTAACKIESKWQGLTNPELDPTQIEGGEEGVREHASTRQKNLTRDEAWATVRVEGRDWGRVLGVGRLGGRVVACFCDDHALILYVYLENDESGADDSVLTYYITSYSQ